jgi:hypothetical protein
VPVVPVPPQRIGYVAQHGLFEQLPALMEDFSVPSYCGDDVGAVNAWFGTAGEWRVDNRNGGGVYLCLAGSAYGRRGCDIVPTAAAPIHRPTTRRRGLSSAPRRTRAQNRRPPDFYRVSRRITCTNILVALSACLLGPRSCCFASLCAHISSLRCPLCPSRFLAVNRDDDASTL